jgi:putative NADH-flavin reductase
MNKPKKVLIVAASSDIGKHIVESFAKRGYELLLTSTDINLLKPISENVIKKHNVKVQNYQFDITDLDQVSSYKPGHIYAAGFIRVKASLLIGEVKDANDQSNILRISAASIWALLLLIAILMLKLFFIFKKRRQVLNEQTQ